MIPAWIYGTSRVQFGGLGVRTWPRMALIKSGSETLPAMTNERAQQPPWKGDRRGGKGGAQHESQTKPIGDAGRRDRV